MTERAARVSTEHLSIHIHPSYLNSQPQRAASRASTIPVFHLQQLRLNLSLALLLLCFSDCLFHCQPLSLSGPLYCFSCFLSFPFVCIFAPWSPSGLLSPSLKSRTWLRPLQCPGQEDQGPWLVGRPKDAPILGQKEAGAQLRGRWRCSWQFCVFQLPATCLHLKISTWFHLIHHICLCRRVLQSCCVAEGFDHSWLNRQAHFLKSWFRTLFKYLHYWEVFSDFQM